METNLPTPMNARVVMLVYHRVMDKWDINEDIMGISWENTWWLIPLS